MLPVMTGKYIPTFRWNSATRAEEATACGLLDRNGFFREPHGRDAVFSDFRHQPVRIGQINEGVSFSVDHSHDMQTFNNRDMRSVTHPPDAVTFGEPDFIGDLRHRMDASALSSRPPACFHPPLRARET